MDEVKNLAASVDPLLSCCICQYWLHDAVQLKCLHNCCRQCFSSAASAAGSEGVCCAACGLVTKDGCEQPNSFVDGQVQRYRSMAQSRVCGVCEGNGEHDKPAVVWCAACRHSLCGDCIAVHRQYFRQHVTQSLEELSSLDEVCRQPSASTCGIHKKPLDIACLNCEQAKCISCWAECNGKKHEMLIVGEKSFKIYVEKFIDSIASLESELLQKSEVLQKPKRMLRDMKEARDRHLHEISERKRGIVDAVDTVYQEIELCTKNAYDDVEAEGHAAAEIADRIDSDLSDARNYVRRLVDSDEQCEIINQQRIVRERLCALSAELECFSERLTTTVKEVKLEASLPDALEDVVRAWIGMPRMHAAWSSPPTSQQQQQQSFTFGTASASFKLPDHCVDVALAQDGRSLLLAARECGLIELSSTNGRELSRWRPPKYSSIGDMSGDYKYGSSGQDDWVLSVAAVSDDRAAVSLHYAQLNVVLLRRNVKSSGHRSTGDMHGSISDGAAAAAVEAEAGDEAWTEGCRLKLLFSPLSVCRLSAHGDVLAAACDKRLQLVSLSSGRRLSDTELRREYNVRSLAVAARLVITGSSEKVKLGGGRRAAHVLDAHSLDEDGGRDKRLWRHVLCSCSDSGSQQEEEELLWGVCADSSGGCLYAAVCRSDKSSGRVSALCLADGSELRRVALSFCSPATAAAAPPPLLLPVQLSLCDYRAAAELQQGRNSCSGRLLLLASLCWDSATKEWRTVTVHRSTSN